MDERCKFAHTKEELRRAGTASASNAANGGAALQMQELQAQRHASITGDDHAGNPLPSTPTTSDIDQGRVLGFTLAPGQDISPCGSVDSDGGAGNFPQVYSAEMPVFAMQANETDWGSGPAPNTVPRAAWASWPLPTGGGDSEVFSLGIRDGRPQETDEEDFEDPSPMFFAKADSQVHKVAFARQMSAPEGGKTGIRDFMSHWKDETMNLLQVKNTFLTFEFSEPPRNSLRRVRSLPGRGHGGLVATCEMPTQEELPTPRPRIQQATASESLAARYMTA